MAKAPVSAGFTIWVDDWLGSESISLMTAEQEGAYVRLLIRAWTQESCSLPDDDAQLAALSRLGKRWSTAGAAVRRQFEPHPTISGRIINRKLWEQRQEKDAWHERQRESGRLGGEKSGEVRRGKLTVVPAIKDASKP